jgi:hypothetical protein
LQFALQDNKSIDLTIQMSVHHRKVILAINIEEVNINNLSIVYFPKKNISEKKPGYAL